MAHEYNNNTTSQSCNYGNLGNYNSGYSMNVAAQGKVTSGAFITPTWAPIGYEDLTGNGVSTCSGYADIDNAYSQASGGNCQTTYNTKLCGGSTPTHVIPPHKHGFNPPHQHGFNPPHHRKV